MWVNVKVPDIIKLVTKKVAALSICQGGCQKGADFFNVVTKWYNLSCCFQKVTDLSRCLTIEFSARFARFVSYFVNKAVPL